MTITTWLNEASEELSQAGINSARLDAELILAHTIRKPRTYLHAHGDEKLSDRHEDIANARLHMRLERTPIAYIIGHKEFYGRQFKTTPAALIPRPESETIIEMLREILTEPLSGAGPWHLDAVQDNSEARNEPYKKYGEVSTGAVNAAMRQETPAHPAAPDGRAVVRRYLVDVGTGTGCLGITAKLEWPELDVTLIDISNHALGLAKDNAKRLHADVHFLKNDLLRDYATPIDIIVANLPYVDRAWEVSPETHAEPSEALYADKHGLALIYQLIEQAAPLLNPGGHLLLESDLVQQADIIAKVTRHGLKHEDTRGLITHFIRS